MADIAYVYPNVSGIQQRGGLIDRWQLAKEVKCSYVEVPADFIKNKTETKKTGLNLGDFLTEKAIAALYSKDTNVPKGLKYILHTEPSLTRKDGYGITHQAPLKWYDRAWVEQFVTMVISISLFLGGSAHIIEIHPGDKRNTFEHILTSIELLLERYRGVFALEPQVLIENRTGQFISSGKDIADLWQCLSRRYQHLGKKAGIVLDVQQLFTVTRGSLLKEFEMIPDDALKGFHIHSKHRVPELSNEIPWRHVFKRIRSIGGTIIVNPEIHHKNKVKDAIEFCENLLKS